MEMREKLIEVSGLAVKSGNHYLLDGINWTVRRGDQWVVFGANGSGKTTLLSAVAGYRRYDDGRIRVFDELLSEATILDVRRRIGWVSSSFFDNYYRNESVLEIVLAGMTGMLGLDFSIGEDDIRRAVDWLSLFGLKDKRDMPFNTLSKGQRQTVLLVRALVNGPDVLILDEPCSGLDVDARERVLGMVSDIARESNTTVIYVTHYFEELLDVFNHALLLKHGRTFAAGTMDECFNDKVVGDLLDRVVRLGRGEDNRMQIHLEETVGERRWTV